MGGGVGLKWHKDNKKYIIMPCIVLKKCWFYCHFVVVVFYFKCSLASSLISEGFTVTRVAKTSNEPQQEEHVVFKVLGKVFSSSLTWKMTIYGFLKECNNYGCVILDRRMNWGHVEQIQADPTLLERMRITGHLSCQICRSSA